jgi:ABC-type lipoprotein release transport system permease subunit
VEAKKMSNDIIMAILGSIGGVILGVYCIAEIYEKIKERGEKKND